MPTMQVIVPAHQAESTIGPCMDGILAAGFSKDQILVVDDGSRDRTAEIVRDMNIRMISNETPARPAKARNRGVGEVNADIVLFVDADVILQSPVREQLTVHFADPELTAVIGSYDDRAASGSVVSDYRNLLHHHVHQRAGGPSRTFWTGIGAVRREAFLAAGGLDSEWENIEDVEFGLRLSAQEGRILLDPEIQGTHLKVWTPKSMFATDLFGRSIPWSRLIMSGRTQFGSLNTGWRHQLAAASIVLFVAGLVAGLFWAPLFAVSALAVLLFVIGSADILGTLHSKRGALFAVRALPWHLLHYCAGSLGYVSVRLQHALGR